MEESLTLRRLSSVVSMARWRAMTCSSAGLLYTSSMLGKARPA